MEKSFSNYLVEGVIVNVLNPHPYLFWFTIGAPQIFSGRGTHPIGPIFFVTGFYIALIGSKIAGSAVVGKSRAFLKTNIIS
jgi:threonine/homoserine/homoserine lactone efflux protein